MSILSRKGSKMIRVLMFVLCSVLYCHATKADDLDIEVEVGGNWGTYVESNVPKKKSSLKLVTKSKKDEDYVPPLDFVSTEPGEDPFLDYVPGEWFVEEKGKLIYRISTKNAEPWMTIRRTTFLEDGQFHSVKIYVGDKLVLKKDINVAIAREKDNDRTKFKLPKEILEAKKMRIEMEYKETKKP